jgi:hypothetical protein
MKYTLGKPCLYDPTIPCNFSDSCKGCKIRRQQFSIEFGKTKVRSKK